MCKIRQRGCLKIARVLCGLSKLFYITFLGSVRLSMVDVKRRTVGGSERHREVLLRKAD